MNFIGLKLGNDISPLIVADVPFGAEFAERVDQLIANIDGQREALNDSIGVVLAIRLESGYRQRRGCQLERRVARDIEHPIRMKVGCLARIQVSIRDGQKISDFLAGGLWSRSQPLLRQSYNVASLPRTNSFFSLDHSRNKMIALQESTIKLA